MSCQDLLGHPTFPLVRNQECLGGTELEGEDNEFKFDDFRRPPLSAWVCGKVGLLRLALLSACVGATLAPLLGALLPQTNNRQ